MFSQVCRSAVLKEFSFRHKLRLHNDVIFPFITCKRTWSLFHGTEKKSNDYEYSHSFHQQSSVLRILLGITSVIGGTALAIYLIPSLRDYSTKAAPPLKPYINLMDDIVSDWKKKINNIDLSKMPSLKSSTYVVDVPTNDVCVGPTFPPTSDVLRQISEVSGPIEGDVYSAIKTTEKRVNDALADLRSLRDVTRRQLNDGSCKFGPPSFMDSELAVAERKAKESHKKAQKELTHLRAMLDSVKEDASEEEKEALKPVIACYGKLSYDLSGFVTEIRRLQNQNSVFVSLAKADFEDKSKLLSEINSILPESPSGKPLLKGDGSEMTVEEMNVLLLMSLERIAKLQESLKASGDASKRHIATALQKFKDGVDRITQEAVERAIHHEQTKLELERLEWEKQARANTKRELNAALARHADNLAHMIRLKQEESESQFDDRLREAVTEQKEAIEARIRCWVRRMEAIEHVADGRADIDRIAKETQALWLSVQALAFALEMPFSKIGASGNLERRSHEFKSFYTSEPLGSYVDSIKEALAENHEFASVVVESLPREALTDGVWTRQGLLQRFNKVYKTACNVALVDETGGSLWSYAMSWLQARLLFDRLGRRRILARLPGVGLSLLTPESKLPGGIGEGELPDAFCLLASARAAIMPEANDALALDSTSCADIEFAVRLLSQLRGQPAAVAADWIHDARRFLEVHQAIQALLAYATAQNFSAFEERL